ncbi:MAG: hypothetical protein WC025_00475 [Candidatus Magasanikbacteria bacterium]
MKKQISNLPNLLVLVAVLTLAFLASGCGVTSTTNQTPIDSNNSVSQIPITQNIDPSVMGNSNTSEQVAPTTVSNNSAGTSGSGMMGGNGSMMNQYKDGSYSTTGQYRAPSGQETIGISLTLQNDIVTDVNVQTMSNNRTALAYQNMFSDNLKSQVVGKDISSLNLNRVAGASLTTQGFNNAVSIIKSQASL